MRINAVVDPHYRVLTPVASRMQMTGNKQNPDVDADDSGKEQRWRVSHE
jgi:hypothetical protein